MPSAARTWSYDASGFLTGTMDEEGRSSTFTPDGLGRVLKVRRSGLDALGGPTGADVATYEYAPGQDTLRGVTDGDGRRTSYAHDDFGRSESVTSETLSRGGGVWYRYDPRGNVVARGDRDVTVTYAHDGLDRVVSVEARNAGDGSSVSYTYRYDEEGFAGRLTSVVEPDRTVRYGYDWAGRLFTEEVTENGVATPLVTTYRYEEDGALRELVYPSGLTVILDRDPATGRTATVRSGDGTVYASEVAYEPGGPLASLRFGNGRTLAQTYTLRYEPLEVLSGPLSLSYGPSPAGDVGMVTDRSEDPSGACVHEATRSFRYDFLDRLSEWSDTVEGGAGICPAESLGGTGSGYRYVPGTDQIAAQEVPGPGGRAAYAFGYDGQGNVSALGRYDASGSAVEEALCLRHDALGRLVQVGRTGTRPEPGGAACLTDGEVTETLGRFRYDARNRRVAREVGGAWTYVVPDGAGKPLSELLLANGSWTAARDYVWLGDRLLAQVEYDGAGTHRYWAHVDHLGTPRALTNAAGQVVWATYQRPYGEVGEKTVVDPLSGKTVVTNLRLPGQYDERLFAAAGISGLQGPYYNWNRWYLPSMGRYMELDPIAVRGGFNGIGWFAPDWYNYGGGNPLTNVDPSGRQAAPCLPTDTTVGCCLKTFPGQFERCNGGVRPDPPRPPLFPWPPPWWPWKDPDPDPAPDDCSPKKGEGCDCMCVKKTPWGNEGPYPNGNKTDANACKSACQASYGADAYGYCK